MECVEGVDAKLVTDVLKLVQGFDLKKLMGSMQGGDGSLDTMVASLTRSMLAGDAAAPRDGTIVHPVSLSLAQAQLGKRKKVRVRRTKAGVREQREACVCWLVCWCVGGDTRGGARRRSVCVVCVVGECGLQAAHKKTQHTLVVRARAGPTSRLERTHPFDTLTR